MNNQILTKFLEQTFYRGQITKHINALRAFLENKFFNSPLPQIIPEDQTWLNSLGEDFYKNFNKLNVYQSLNKLEKAIKNLLTLTIYLAFEMPAEEKDKLGSYLRENFKKDLILEIKLDPNLIGGAAISWKGVYKDYSLKSRIEQNHDQVLSSLKSFSA